MPLEYREWLQAWPRLDHDRCPIGEEDGDSHVLLHHLLEEGVSKVLICYP